MNQSNCKHSSHGSLIAMSLFSISMVFGNFVLCGQSAFEQLRLGRALLSDGDYRAAHVIFEDVLASHPEDDTARFFLAFTTLISVIDNPKVQSTMDAFGVSMSGRDPFSWTADIPTSQTGWPVPPNGSTSKDLLDLLRDEFIPALGVSLNHLRDIDDPDFFIFLTAEETGTQTVIVDWGDLSLMRSALMLLESFIWTLDSYDLDASLTRLFTMREDQSIDLESLLKAFPNLLRLAGNESFTLAAGSLTGSLLEFQKASTFIKNRSAGASRLFTLEPEDVSSLNDLETVSSEILQSIREGFVRLSLVEDYSISVSLKQFYSAEFAPRSLIPKFKGNYIVPGTFADPSFSNTVVGLNDGTIQELMGKYMLTPIAGIEPQDFSGQRFLLTVRTMPGESYVLYESADLRNWTQVKWIYATGKITTIPVAASQVRTAHFYKISRP